MFAGNSMAVMMTGLVGAGAASIGGWSMYYIEKQDHAAAEFQLSAEVESHRETIAALTEQSDGLRAKGGDLETSMDDLIVLRDGLQSGLAESEREREALQAEVSAIAQERDALLANLDKTRQAYDALQSSFTEVTLTRDDLKENLRSTASEQQRLEGERSRLGDSLDSAVSEQEHLAAELQGMLEARDQLGHDLEQTKGERDRLQADLDQRIHAKEVELSASTNRIEQLNAQLIQSNRKIGMLETKVRRLEQERDAIASRFAELEHKLQSEMTTASIEIEQLKHDFTVIRVAGDILFDTGSAELKDEGREALGHIAAALIEMPERRISLEGHTDAVPIADRLKDKYSTNWELSTARAARAARYLANQGISPLRLRAVGYGEFKPVADNDDPGQRGRNRRLEIMLLPRNQNILDRALSGN